MAILKDFLDILITIEPEVESKLIESHGKEWDKALSNSLKRIDNASSELSINEYEQVALIAYFRHNKGLSSVRRSINKAIEEKITGIDKIYEFVKGDLRIR